MSEPASPCPVPGPALDPDWLLAGFDLTADRFQFARVTRQTYADSAFLDHRIQPRPVESMSLNGEQVDEVLRHSRVRQSSWIFHTGFCGSTLLATCLDHPGHTLVLREPLVLSRLAHALRGSAAGNEAGPGNGMPKLTERVMGLCERSYAREALLVKPSNFANRIFDTVMSPGAAVADRRAVVMSCSLESLLVSILKKRSEAESLLPGFVTALLQDSDYLGASGLPGTQGLDLLQLAVVFWHCQRHFLRQHMATASSGALLRLDMERFLAEPESVLREVAHFFRLELPDERIRQTVDSGAFRRHSKQSLTDYSPGEYHRERQATRERYAAKIDGALHWAETLLDKIPQDLGP